jgi:hypothetical protein
MELITMSIFIYGIQLDEKVRKEHLPKEDLVF